MGAGPRSGSPSSTGQRIREVVAGAAFRRLFASRAASQFGDGLFQLAAVEVLIFEEPGANPALRLAAVTAITLIPFSLIGPFVGVFIDRWERRSILMWTPAIRAGLVVLAPLVSANDVAFGFVVLVVLSANRLFLATVAAVLPLTVPEDDLLVANSIASTGGSVTTVLGLSAGTLITSVTSSTGTALAAALAFAGAALLSSRLGVSRGHPSQRDPLAEEIRQVLAEMVEGLRGVWTRPRVRYALAAVATVQLLVGAMSGAVIFYFVAVLGLEVESSLGLLGSIALGIGLGVVLVPFANRWVRHDRLIPVSFLLSGGALLFAGASLSRTVVVGAGVFAGMSYAFAKIPVDTIVQEEMADAFRGRAFAAYDMLFNLARVAGAALVALAFQAALPSVSPAPAVVAIGIAHVVAFGAYWAWERRLEAAGVVPAAEPAAEPAAVAAEERSAITAPTADGGSVVAMLEPGEMVVVRSYAGARADEEPREIEVGGTRIPITSIEWRAVVQDRGERRRVFVVTAGGQRVRLSVGEQASHWQVDRILPPPTERG